MMNRRLFVQGLSAAAVATKSIASLAETALPTLSSDSTPIRLGIIGPGSRGKELIRNALRVPGVKVVAAADVYPPRFQQLNQLCGYEVAAHHDYRALVERKDLDAIIVSTPLSFHAEHVLAALKSGHHVYGEKTMAFTVDETNQIVRAVESGKKVFQVGHQYRYAAWIQEGIKRIQQGEIGDLTHVYAYWHRNNNWRRPVPDPSLERLINWRLYKQYSHGLLSELASHHIDLANWAFGEAPQTAYATGSIAVYHDGREVNDNVQSVLGYSKGRRFVFSSITDNAMMGDQLWFYGTKGSLNLTLEDATFYYEPKHATRVRPKSGIEGRGIMTGASYRPAGEMPYRGAGKPIPILNREDPTQTAVRSFIQCARTGEKPISDVQNGARVAMAVITAYHSIDAKRELEIPVIA
ncbi:MAG TPA: Gfo/Idh/MocA family oxidoreductase [Edaphobacter sp.]|nr:Gfo/Idh/MocA family oxidoreductase [Edaphobacter sp.]